jgi:hypothetical protein
VVAVVVEATVGLVVAVVVVLVTEVVGRAGHPLPEDFAGHFGFVECATAVAVNRPARTSTAAVAVLQCECGE